MAFWSATSKPTGIKDPDAILDYPVNFADWLLNMGATYASHEVILTGGLVRESVMEDEHVAGVIAPVLSGGAVGETATFTIRIVAVDGRSDDRTLSLKIKER